MPTRKQPKKKLKLVSVSIRFTEAEHATIVSAVSHNKEIGDPLDSFQRFVRTTAAQAADNALQPAIPGNASSMPSPTASK